MYVRRLCVLLWQHSLVLPEWGSRINAALSRVASPDEPRLVVAIDGGARLTVHSRMQILVKLQADFPSRTAASSKLLLGELLQAS